VGRSRQAVIKEARRNPGEPGLKHRVRIALVCGVLLAWLALPAGAAGPIELHVDRSASVLQVRATLPVAAPAQLCYAVVADFDRLAEFIPGLRSSQVVSEPGQPVLLRQVGEATLGISRYAIDVTLGLDIDPPRQISFTRVAGNLAVMHGRWLITGDAARCTVDYRADLEPDFWVPPVVGPFIVRRQVQTQLEALGAEIDRRVNTPQTYRP
jgi:ribosome-associated toxin RatA of RatAB toxin-antitoxin module